MKRLNKEYSLNINKYIDVKFGCVNRENPIVLYIEGKSWICPKYSGDYNSDITTIMDNCKENLKSELNCCEKFSNKFFFDFDVKTASLRENKKSFMTFEILVRQNGKPFAVDEIKGEVESMFKDIIECLAVDFNDHIFCLDKRK